MNDETCLYLHTPVSRSTWEITLDSPLFIYLHSPPSSRGSIKLAIARGSANKRKETRKEREREKEFDREQSSKHKNYTKTEKNHVMNYNVFLRCQGA